MDFWSGNQAIVEAALAAGARFFAGYPITPASTIMEEWARRAEQDRHLIFLQSEDEIAAIHQVIGASLAGKPAFTATSGPGLSLMQEGLGLAFVYGAPIVVIDVQRSGPSTGQPTRAGQGEILATRFGSHGDLLPFVFYPTSVADCYQLTLTAFKLAWQHQLPVILLTDAYLATMQETIQQSKKQNSLKKISLAKHHFTGLTDRQTVAQKIEQIREIGEKQYRYFHLFGQPQAETLLIGLGIVARALQAFARDYQIFAPLRIWPPLVKDLKKIAQNKRRVVIVEMNQGQYWRQVEQILKRRVDLIRWQEEKIDLKKLKQLIQ